MFTDFIEKLRKKPEESRVMILWSSVIIIMIVIVALWTIFGIKQNTSPQNSDTGAKETSSFFKQLGELFSDAKEGAQNLKNDLSKVWQDTLNGKNDPTELPADIKEYVTDDALLNNPPLTLPQTK